MFSKILATLSWIAVLVLWACAASVYAHPDQWWSAVGVLGLCFPFGVAAVVGMGVLCLLFKPKLAWIAAVGLLACCGSLRDYCPINLASPPPKGCLKVMTYNVCCFDGQQPDAKGDYPAMVYLYAKKPDIVCLQEAFEVGGKNADSLRLSARRHGYHYRKEKLGGSMLGLLSRFPIAKSEIIFRSQSNGAAAFWLLPPGEDTIVVVNAHLESMRLNSADRSNYVELIHHRTDSVKDKLGFLRKIADACHERAHQGDSLAQFIDRMQGRRLIVMGDFNDTPISYAHRQVCSRLTDAYRATGNGIGRSFHKDAIYVRIDNIFCSDHWKPFAAMVENSVDYSDHYPVSAYLKPQ